MVLLCVSYSKSDESKFNRLAQFGYGADVMTESKWFKCVWFPFERGVTVDDPTGGGRLIQNGFSECLFCGHLGDVEMIVSL